MLDPDEDLARVNALDDASQFAVVEQDLLAWLCNSEAAGKRTADAGYPRLPVSPWFRCLQRLSQSQAVAEHITSGVGEPAGGIPPSWTRRRN